MLFQSYPRKKVNPKAMTSKVRFIVIALTFQQFRMRPTLGAFLTEPVGLY